MWLEQEVQVWWIKRFSGWRFGKFWKFRYFNFFCNKPKKLSLKLDNLNKDDLEKLLTQSDRLKIINDELNYLKLGHFVDEVKFNNKIGLYKYDGISN